MAVQGSTAVSSEANEQESADAELRAGNQTKHFREFLPTVYFRPCRKKACFFAKRKNSETVRNGALAAPVSGVKEF